MKLRPLALLAMGAALALAPPALAEKVQFDTTANTVKIGCGGPYTLLSNASASGTSSQVQGGCQYIWSVQGTIGGATFALMALGPDGTNYMQVASVTAAGTTIVNLGPGAVVKVTITGGTPSGIYSSLG